MKLNIEAIKAYLSTQEDIVCAYLFGSFAKGRENQYSDVDIALLLEPGVDKREYTDRQISMVNELSKIAKSEVDIILLNRANTFLKYQVFKYAKRIYEKVERKNRSFEAKSILEYLDFLPIRARLESGLIQKIKKG